MILNSFSLDILTFIVVLIYIYKRKCFFLAVILTNNPNMESCEVVGIAHLHIRLVRFYAAGLCFCRFLRRTEYIRIYVG